MKNVNIYATDDKGKSFLLKENIKPNEALTICNDYYKNTGLTAIMVICD